MKKYLITSLVLTIVLFFGYQAQANPSFFIRQNNGTTITATTTMLGYLTPGTATTTVNFDSQANGNPNGVESAILALQLTGSTTPVAGSNVATTTYKVSLSYSQDNIDWYSDSSFATTTVLGWQTIGGVLIASTTPTKIFVNVPTPTRYTRAIISIPAGSTNGAVWAEFIAKKQN